MAEPTVNYEQLIAFAAGALNGAEAQVVEQYISRNAEAAATVARFRLVQQRIATDDSVEPSGRALAKAHKIFADQMASTKPDRLGWLEAIDRFIAKLIFDSRVTPLAVRNTALDQRINLTFELAQGEIDLQAEPLEEGEGEGPQTWHLIGQASDAGALREVALTKTGSTHLIARASADEYGSFELESPAGHYDLHLRFDGSVAVVGGIELQ